MKKLQPTDAVFVILGISLGLGIARFNYTLMPLSPPRKSFCIDVSTTSQQRSDGVDVKVTRSDTKTMIPKALPVPYRFGVRVLCWVLTTGMFHDARAKYVKQTWGKRCDKLLFFSDTVDTQLETIDLKVGRGRGGLRNKTVMALDLLYKEYVHDYDWFMKADDDTFVIVENLRYLLSEHSPSDPVWFGHRFKRVVSQGYLSGGAGYVLSRKALQKFGTRPADCTNIKGAEDVELGRCMQKLGVQIGDSRDAFGKTRFHSFPAEDHLTEFYPDWYYLYDWYNATSGIGNMSDHAITFHYIRSGIMSEIDYLIYHLRVKL